MKIDSDTMVPVSWVLGGFSMVILSVVTATFWVSSVNQRLERIEQKLGIPAYHVTMNPVNTAEAEDKR